MEILFALIVGAFFVSFFGWIELKLRRDAVERAHKQIDEAFAQRVREIAALERTFLVRRQNEVRGTGIPGHVQTHRIYRSGDGTYFLFICTAGEPGYLTQISRERAANALRSTPEIFAQEFPDRI